MASEQQVKKEFEDVIDAWLDDFVDLVFEISQRKLVDSGKIDTATMFKTANINRQRLQKSIVYPTPYSANVHEGRMPGSMPPVAPLVQWAERKLNAENPKSTAFAIAKAIEKRGIEPFPFLEEALDEAIAIMENR